MPGTAGRISSGVGLSPLLAYLSRYPCYTNLSGLISVSLVLLLRLEPPYPGSPYPDEDCRRISFGKLDVSIELLRVKILFSLSTDSNRFFNSAAAFSEIWIEWDKWFKNTTLLITRFITRVNSLDMWFKFFSQIFSNILVITEFSLVIIHHIFPLSDC